MCTEHVCSLCDAKVFFNCHFEFNKCNISSEDASILHTIRSHMYVLPRDMLVKYVVHVPIFCLKSPIIC